MATVLLNGTVTGLGFTSGTTPVSWNDVASFMSCDITNEMFEQTVFSSGKFRARIRGLVQLVGRIGGFMSSGLTISDPLALFATSGPTAFVATFATGCTITGNLQPRNNHVEIGAAATSGMGLDFETYGSFSTAWVTS